MPHLIIDYSANLEAVLDMGAFCEALRAGACQLEAFPEAGIRVRAIPAPHFAIADGDPRHGYIDISVRLRAGRTQDVKAAATQHLFGIARDFIDPIMKTRPIALSFEMRDIDPELSPKAGSIRQFLGP